MWLGLIKSMLNDYGIAELVNIWQKGIQTMVDMYR